METVKRHLLVFVRYKDQYLQFDSHHPLIHKLGVISTLEHRANVVISETAEREKEKAHIKSSLRKCGYPEWAFQKAGGRNRQTNNTDQGDKGQGRTTRANITIPYVAGISEKIKNAFKAHGISTCYKPWNTLRQKLVRVKDSVPKAKRANKIIVYGVKCEDKDCQERYVGETQQYRGPRMNQHRGPRSNPPQTSAVYTHLNFTGHAFTLTDVVVLDREEHWHRRGVKEAIWERVENPSLKRKGGLRHSLSHTWDRTVRLIGSHLSHGTSVT
ncbi:uncharacterized protein [Montipora foliosa]|uniref:uncharacterized protein n=1 Tax=Montipora foliosa TaxID=591990 RepID=UPI0035F17A19